MLKLIGIDLDDSLTKDAIFFVEAEEKFFRLLEAAGASPGQVADARADFYKTEEANIPFCGYGVGKLFKTFIDIAVRHAPDRVDAKLIGDITRLAEELRRYPLAEFDDTREFLGRLPSLNVPCVLITKGESFHQADKVKRMKEALGAEWPFLREFIISCKTEQEYNDILAIRGVEPGEFLMVGDSIRSEANPVLAIGGHAVIVARKNMAGLKRAFEEADIRGDAPHRLDIVSDLIAAADVIQNRVLGEKGPGISRRGDLQNNLA